jgi:hypothetical protein
VGDPEQQRTHLGEQPLLEPGRAAQARVELEGVGRFQALDE